MGNTQTTRDNTYANINKYIDDIIELNGVIDVLKEKCKKYADQSLCLNIALIHTENFNKEIEIPVVKNQHQHQNQYRLGVVADESIKNMFCKKIIQQFVKRLDILTLIQETLNNSSIRIQSFAYGPRCRINPNILNRQQCESGWQEQTALPQTPEKKEENGKYYNGIKLYMNKLKINLESFKLIVRPINDDINSRTYATKISDEQLNLMDIRARELVRKNLELFRDFNINVLTIQHDDTAVLNNEQTTIAKNNYAAKTLSARRHSGLGSTTGRSRSNTVGGGGGKGKGIRSRSRSRSRRGRGRGRTSRS